jgi:hypothetical protein
MPRTPKSSKFFLYVPAKSGWRKGEKLLGVNHSYEGGTENLSLQDLIDFLKEKNINASDVKLNSGFMTTAK